MMKVLSPPNVMPPGCYSLTWYGAQVRVYNPLQHLIDYPQTYPDDDTDPNKNSEPNRASRTWPASIYSTSTRKSSPRGPQSHRRHHYHHAVLPHHYTYHYHHDHGAGLNSLTVRWWNHNGTHSIPLIPGQHGKILFGEEWLVLFPYKLEEHIRHVFFLFFHETWGRKIPRDIEFHLYFWERGGGARRGCG